MSSPPLTRKDRLTSDFADTTNTPSHTIEHKYENC